MPEMDVIFQNALNGSFSVIVAAFLLLRTERELKNLATQLNLLENAIIQLKYCQHCAHAESNQGNQGKQNREH